MRKLLVIGAALLSSTLPTMAASRIVFGYGPAFAPYAWHGPYGWYGPYNGFYPYAPYAMVPNAGELKIDTKLKASEVFVNGDLAGTVGHLKTMTLTPGRYNIEVRSPNGESFSENIHILAGKTFKLRPEFAS